MSTSRNLEKPLMMNGGKKFRKTKKLKLKNKARKYRKTKRVKKVKRIRRKNNITKKRGGVPPDEIEMNDLNLDWTAARQAKANKQRLLKIWNESRRFIYTGNWLSKPGMIEQLQKTPDGQNWFINDEGQVHVNNLDNYRQRAAAETAKWDEEYNMMQARDQTPDEERHREAKRMEQEKTMIAAIKEDPKSIKSREQQAEREAEERERVMYGGFR